MENTITIEPTRDVASYKQHSIAGLSLHQMCEKLGFFANTADDPLKVRFCWNFTINGKPCAVWDWKGSYHSGEWSAFGPLQEMRAVFGANLFSKEASE